jgi:hypothetical protein
LGSRYCRATSASFSKSRLLAEGEEYDRKRLARSELHLL